jgi:hypothetical protein
VFRVKPVRVLEGPPTKNIADLKRRVVLYEAEGVAHHTHDAIVLHI